MIQVLERAATILDLVARGHPTLTEVVHTSGLHKTTVHNILATLEHLGLLIRDADKRYEIGPRSVSWAEPLIRHDTLRWLAEGVVTQLADRIGETVHVAVLQDGQRVIVARVDSTQTVSVSSRAMEHRRPYDGGSGPVLVAHLDREDLDELIRLYGLPGEDWGDIHSRAALEADLARIRAESVFSRRTVDGQAQLLSSPVLTADGRCRAAICVSLPLSRYAGQHRELVVCELRIAAQRMAEDLDHASLPEWRRPGATAPGSDGERSAPMC